MSRRTLATAILLGILVACDDNSPTAANESDPVAPTAAAAAAADTGGSAGMAALKDSAAALIERTDRPASSVCARRLTELRQVRAKLTDKSAMGAWTSLRSKELMLSAVISDACY